MKENEKSKCEMPQTLEDILRYVMGNSCLKVLKTNGELSAWGKEAYERLTTILYAVGELTSQNSDVDKMIETLDEIKDE